MVQLTNNVRSTIIYLNIQSVVNSIDQLTAIVYERLPIIVGNAETHLKNDIGDWEVAISGYNIVRVDSSSRHTGGVAICIKEGILFEVFHSKIIDKVWMLSIKILNDALEGITYNVSYVSPKMSKAEVVNQLEELVEYLEGIV